MGSRYTQTVPIEISHSVTWANEILLTVLYTHTKGSPAVMYQRNGDPGWPAEPPELEVLSIQYTGVEVPDWFEMIIPRDWLEQYLLDNHQEPERD